MADTVNGVTIGFEPRTAPTEYFYFFHISSYPEVSNTDTIFINDSTLSISVTTAQTTTPEISGSSPIGGREFWEQCLIAVVLSSIALAAMIGNVLVIAAVWRYRRLRSVTNCFVVSLALADLLVSILVLPLNIVVEVTGQWLFGSIVCDLWVSSDVLLCTSSILNLCCISLDRYFAITRPLIYSTRRNKRLAIFMVAVAWGLAAVVTCPPIFGWKEEGRDLADGCSLTRDPGYIIYSSCGSFFIPLLVMLFVYARIYHVASKREKRLRPYWRTFFDGHQRQQSSNNEGAVCKRQFVSSSSVDGDNSHGPPLSSPTSACPTVGHSRSTSLVTGARPSSLIRDTTTPTENDEFNCRITGHRNEKGFLRRFKSSLRRCSKTQSRRFCNRTEGTTIPGTSNQAPTRHHEVRLTNPSEHSGGGGSTNNRRISNSSNNTCSNNKIKPSKNKLRLFSSCYPHHQQQSHYHQQLYRNNDNHEATDVTERSVALTPSMTQASVPLLTPAASFNDDFNSGEEDEPAITLVNIKTNRDDEKDSTKLPLSHSNVSQCNSSRKSGTSKTTTNRRSDNISSGYRPLLPRRLLHSSLSNQKPSYDRSGHNTDPYTDRGRLKRRLGLDRRRMIPRRYITSLSSRTSRHSLKSCRPTLEITPPSPSPRSNRPVSTSIATSIISTTTTSSTDAIASAARRLDGESASSRHLTRLPAGPEEASVAENRRRNRVVERSLYMKERKTAKTLAIVVGCFVVCWLPFFLIYVIDVFCTQCHVTPTLFSALTWLGYFNSALNPLIYALYNTGFRHAFWNLTFGLCFAGERRSAHLLPSVTSYGGRTVTGGANLKSAFSTVTDTK